MMKRPWKILLIIVLLGMGCSPTDLLGDLIETPDLVMPDGQTGDLAYQDNAGDELVGDLSAEVDQWILDTSEVAEELDVGVQCQPGDGCFLDSCSDNSECQSGWCVEHMGEGVCTQACQEECPPGWTCQTTGGTGPDMMSICVSNFANLCKPCATTKGCESAGGAEDVCLDYGIEGSFCGGGCAADEDCPWGFLCQEADSIDGVTLKQCVAESGVCPCSQKSVELGLSTPCAVTSEFGTCPGKRVCIEDGLSDCDALVPGLEVCNGIDDNCDGDVDEASFVEGEYVNLCDDGNECTKDACKGEDGCANTALDGEECKDGNPCTVADLCIAGICVGSVVDCNDDNPCTDGDICNAGTCQSGAELTCDDANVCTDDSCAPAQGCLYTPVANYSSCGVGIEVCIDGACVDCPNPTGSQTFNQTGGQQSWTVPDCVTKVTIESWGAQGGGSTCCSGSQEDGGHGGYSKGELSVTAGETLYLYVGSKGNMAGSGGWNGGGAGGQYGGGGGGASDVRQTGTSLTHRVIVAGGGGGGNCGCPDHGHGGAGGGTNGGNGIGNTGHAPAGGGTQNSGGSAGENGGKGAFGTGHSNGGYHMAGGGGGWYGGGSAYAAGGGGGSGYIGGVSNASTTQNNKTGHGQVKISW